MKAKDYFVRDDLLEAAPLEYLHLDSWDQGTWSTGTPTTPCCRRCGAFRAPPLPLEQVYLNTGTWRGRYYKSTQDDSFISWKNMTYVIFYQEGERRTPSRFSKPGPGPEDGLAVPGFHVLAVLGR